MAPSTRNPALLPCGYVLYRQYRGCTPVLRISGDQKRRAQTIGHCSERPALCHHPVRVRSLRACEHTPSELCAARAVLRGTSSVRRATTGARCLGTQRDSTVRTHRYVGERRASEGEVAGAIKDYHKPALNGLHSTGLASSRCLPSAPIQNPPITATM